MERLGLFGGTFDPPHLGHLGLAESARLQLALDCVLWVVAGQSPLKLGDELSPVETRIAMVQAAIAGNSGFAISRADVDRPGPHFSVDTVDLVAREHGDASIYFIMGEDCLRDLPRWRRPADLITKCRLAVFQRPGVDADLSQLEAQIPGLSARLEWVNAPQIEIAASDLRDRARQGRSIRYLVPDAVRELIQLKSLYRSDPAANL